MNSRASGAGQRRVIFAIFVGVVMGYALRFVTAQSHRPAPGLIANERAVERASPKLEAPAAARIDQIIECAFN
jgi:hypothetical protein